MIEITSEYPPDSASIETLLDAAFGTDRYKKSSYGYRHGVARLWPLCRTAREDGTVVGTVRAWPIRIGRDEAPAVLVGPVAVAATQRGAGLGASLIRESLALARELGHGAALLVGDKPYYGRFGFSEAAAFGIEMARENPARVLALQLDPGRAMPTGLVVPWRSVRGLRAAA